MFDSPLKYCNTPRQGRDAAQCTGMFFWHGVGVQKNYLFAAPAKKSGMLFPAFFSQIARAKEWRASWQRKGGGNPKR